MTTDLKQEHGWRRVEPTRSLAFCFPLLAKRWHLTKNGELSPDMVYSKSSKKAWWLCSGGHEHQSVICNMVVAMEKGAPSAGCPYCAGDKATSQNNLAVSFPELSKEWNQDKNTSITPFNTLPYSGFKVWWKCKLGHEWQAVVGDRTARKSGCPKCRLFGISRFEARVFAEIKSLWVDAESKTRILGKECDIFIPTLKLIVEIDGFWWHRNAQERDARKSEILTRGGYQIIRLRETPLPLMAADDVSLEERAYRLDQDTLTVIKALVSRIGEKFGIDVSHYTSGQGFANDSEYEAILKFFPLPAKGSSLAEKFPAITKQWHPVKNGGITPSQLRPKSNKKAWWKCEKGHEWQASPLTRVSGCGCPYCATGQKICSDNSFFAKKSYIAKQWNYEKNVDLDVDKIGTGSTDKVWWRCDEGHEWQAVVKERCRARTSGCPRCAQLRHSERMKGNDFRHRGSQARA